MKTDLQKAYHDKFISMDEALSNIKSGDVIAVAAYGNEPVRFLRRLHEIKDRGVRDVTLWLANPQEEYPFLKMEGMEDVISILSIFYGKSLFIELAQMGKRGVGVGEGLEIGQVFHVRVFSGEELFALFQLLGNAFLVVAIGWVEGLVVAESASTSSHQSIAVGTCEPSVNSNLLDTKGELLTNPSAVVDV